MMSAQVCRVTAEAALTKIQSELARLREFDQVCGSSSDCAARSSLDANCKRSHPVRERTLACVIATEGHRRGVRTRKITGGGWRRSWTAFRVARG